MSQNIDSGELPIADYSALKTCSFMQDAAAPHKVASIRVYDLTGKQWNQRERLLRNFDLAPEPLAE